MVYYTIPVKTCVILELVDVTGIALRLVIINFIITRLGEYYSYCGEAVENLLHSKIRVYCPYYYDGIVKLPLSQS